METLKEAFGRRLRAMRESRNVTREAMSQHVDLDPQSIYRIEKGIQWVAPEKLDLVAKFFRASPAVFFTDSVVKIEPSPAEILRIVEAALHAQMPPVLRAAEPSPHSSPNRRRIETLLSTLDEEELADAIPFLEGLAGVDEPVLPAELAEEPPKRTRRKK